MDEERLIEKLRLLETLHSRAITPGEKVAAAAAAERAKERNLERLRVLEEEHPPMKFRFTMDDM